MSELDSLISGSNKSNNGWTKSERIIRRNKRKIKKRNCVLLTTSIAVLGSVFGIMVFFRNASDPNTAGSSSIIGRATQAKSMINIDYNTGEYSVDFNLSPIPIVPNETTFAELAEIMLLPWYEASLVAIEDDKAWDDGGITPSKVKDVRRVMLMARDMLDVFGPVFPDTPYGRTVSSSLSSSSSSKKKKKKKKKRGKDRSLWRDLRKQYRDGYELLGELKDLDGLTYSQELLAKRTNDVMVWKNTFLQFQKKYRIRRFLYTREISKGGGIDPIGCYQHKSSHLFWAETPTIPCGNDIGTKSLQSLAKVQLTHSLEYLNTIKDYKTVMPKSHELNFHNLRKELRIFLDEYNLFGNILVPDHTTNNTIAIAGSSSASTTTSDTVETTDTTTADNVNVNDNENDNALLLLKNELIILNTAQKMLGHINDKWTAHEIYIEDNSHKSKQQPLADKTDKKWRQFLIWSNKNSLKDCITNVLNRMS